MTKGNIIILIVLGIFLILLWAGSISIFKEYKDIAKKNNELMARINNLKIENQESENDINFYGVPENLEKKMREDFNYKKPGEKMIIIVPNN